MPLYATGAGVRQSEGWSSSSPLTLKEEVDVQSSCRRPVDHLMIDHLMTKMSRSRYSSTKPAQRRGLHDDIL
eukprot:g17557.t1